MLQFLPNSTLSQPMNWVLRHREPQEARQNQAMQAREDILQDWCCQGFSLLEKGAGRPLRKRSFRSHQRRRMRPSVPYRYKNHRKTLRETQPMLDPNPIKRDHLPRQIVPFPLRLNKNLGSRPNLSDLGRHPGKNRAKNVQRNLYLIFKGSWCNSVVDQLSRFRSF
jgi:hypothetical protein